MRTRKYGILGLMLGASLLAAACDSETTAPPPAVTVTVSPDPVPPLNIGQTVQMVAVVANSTNQQVTWTSSTPAVASVSATGLVTALTQGVTVITATSAADPNARDAVTIQVNPPAAPPTVSIKSVTSGGLNTPVNPQNVFGQIDVTLNVEVPTGAQVERVETLIDGAVVCSQSFQGGADIATGDEADAPQVEIVCSINTAAFNATTGAVTFPNGSHTLTARLVQPGGNIIATPSTALIFNNANFLNVAFSGARQANSGAGPRSLAPIGSLWLGGDITANVISVNYGGAANAVASLSVTLTSSGTGATGITGCQTTGTLATDPTISSTDGGAGAANTPGCAVASAARTVSATTPVFTVVFPANALMSAASPGLMNVEEIFTPAVTSTTSGGQAGPTCINPAPGTNPQGPTCVAVFPTPLRVDNLAPRVTLFDLTPPTCDTPNCYVNGSFAFAPRAGFFASVDYGVDHQDPRTTFEAGAATSSLVAVTTAATLNDTQTNADLFLRVTVRDSLGNQRQVFPTSNNTIVTTSSGSALKFGVDKVIPYIASATVPPDSGANDPFSYTIAAADTATPPAGPSGINTGPSGPQAPIVVRAERINTGGTSCLDPDAGAVTTFSCTTGGNQGNGTEAVANLLNFTLGNPTTPAYYRVSYFARDRADNKTATSVDMTLFDNVAPGMGAVVGPSIITGNASVAFSTTATDNLDLGDVASYIGYGAIGIGSFVQDIAAPATIGTYGPDTFTTSATATSTIPTFIRSIQVGLGGAINRALNVTFNVRDVAGVVDNNICPATGAPNTSLANCTSRRDDITAAVNAGIGASNPETSFGTVPGFNAFNTLAPSAATVCNGTTQPAPPGQPCPTNPASTVLSARASGASATFQANPFVRVNFYYFGPSTGGRSILIGSGTQTATTDDGTTRAFNWQITWTPAGLAPGAYTVFALGVDSKGQGLVFDTQNVNVTID